MKSGGGGLHSILEGARHKEAPTVTASEWVIKPETRVEGVVRGTSVPGTLREADKSAPLFWQQK